MSYVALAGSVVEVDPAVLACYDTLCAEHHAVFFLIFKLAHSVFDLLAGILLGSFDTPGCEHLVCVVMMVAVAAASAGAFLTVVVVVMLVVMTTAVAILVVMVMMLVVMATAITILVMMMVVMLVMMLVAAAVAVLIVMVVMVAVVMVVSLLLHMVKLCGKSVSALDNCENIAPADLVPISCNETCAFVVSADHFNSLCHLVIGKSRCVAEDDGARVFYLVIEKLTEVLHVHSALISL